MLAHFHFTYKCISLLSVATLRLSFWIKRTLFVYVAMGFRGCPRCYCMNRALWAYFYAPRATQRPRRQTSFPHKSWFSKMGVGTIWKLLKTQIKFSKSYKNYSTKHYQKTQSHYVFDMKLKLATVTSQILSIQSNELK